jgi:peptidoglycan/xylan/chitin deacetylase (PgdA/CDA1 family)
LTFDDGYTDFADRAMPILRRQGVAPAAVFVCPEHVGQDAHWNYRARQVRRHMDRATLRQLSSEGVAIEAHGLRHRNFCQIAPAQLAEELDVCRQWFARELDRETSLLAYPYGDYLAEHLPVVGERLAYAFTVIHGTGFGDRRAISRRCVGEQTSQERLLAPIAAVSEGPVKAALSGLEKGRRP